VLGTRAMLSKWPTPTLEVHRGGNLNGPNPQLLPLMHAIWSDQI